MKLGDEIIAKIRNSNEAPRPARIVGESRDKRCWWIVFLDRGSQKTRYAYHKSFCQPPP